MKKYIILILCCILVVGCSKKKENLFDNPDIDIIQDSIKNISNISSICKVTPNHDPNGNLNDGKGGYNGALYFTHSKVEFILENDERDACDKGTIDGGSIETYNTEKDAQNRYDYLLKWGSAAGHTYKKGKVIIRLSSRFTDSYKKIIYDEIIESMEATTN